MSSPLQRQRAGGARRSAVVRTASVPAPIRGLNSRDAIAAMKATDALVLDNFFPGVSDCSLRPGYRAWATGLGGDLESILPYRSASTSKLFAAAGGSVFDVTGQGPVGPAVLTGLANARWQHVNFGTPGGQFLLMVNGADPMRVFNGTAWQTVGTGVGVAIVSITYAGTAATVTTAAPHGLGPGNTVTVTGAAPAQYNVAGAAITILSPTTFRYVMASAPSSNATAVGSYTVALAVTGFDTSKAIAINAYGERIWLIERNSFRVWYLGVQALAGAATSIDLASLFKLGGSLAGMITWTLAGSTETAQFAVFVSTEGEVVIYTGDNPASADGWRRTGTARIGRPVGGRFWTKVGTDVALICSDGFVPLSQVLQADRKDNAAAISSRIVNAATAAVQRYGSAFGWQVTLHSSGSKLFVNVPGIGGAPTYQFVMNTITGAWCRYVGLDARVWEATQDALFFGGAGAVYQAEYGTNDDGRSIYGTMLPAFATFGSPSLGKRFTQVRPTVVGAGSIKLRIELKLNFDGTGGTATPPLTYALDAPQWNVSPWNTTPWRPAERVSSEWYAVGGLGFAAAALMQINSKNVPVSIQALTYVFEPGGLLGG